MKDNQKGLGLVRGLLIFLIAAIVIVGVIGFVSWKTSDPENSTSETSNAECTLTAQNTSNNFQLPAGWSWHEFKDIGLKFAYPTSWGTATDQTDSGGILKYVSSFTEESSGANTRIELSSDCLELQSTLSDINNGKFNTLSGPTVIKAISHDQSSYSSLSHWSSDSGNQYEFIANNAASVGSIKSILVNYSIVTGAEICPDDRLASSDQPNCINQTVSDEVKTIISSLQKI